MPNDNPSTDQPNVLLIMSDQHNAQFMGCAGDQLSPTPHLDQLAASGIRMSNAHCPYPLCGPSRMAFMTSRQPHDTGCLSNLCQLRSDEPTFAHAFGRAGYQTVIAGRMHFIGHDQLHGFHERIISDGSHSAYIHSRKRCNNLALGPMMSHGRGMGPSVLRISGPGEQAYQAYDEAVTDTTCRWLQERDTDATKPFMLTVGTVMPHCPFVALPEDFYHFYDQISVDDLPDPNLDILPPAMRELRKSWGLDKDPVSRETQRVVRAAYYGMVRHMDRLIGKMLQTLHDTGLDRNTIVVYVSDHGEQLGEHGLWWKSSFYQSSVGVPLIISKPGQLDQGKVISQNVCLTDIGPTLLDLVGAQPLAAATGRSFRTLLETGSDSQWPDVVYSQIAAEVPGPARMVRSGPWKLMCYDGHEPLLFNLDDDPCELINRADDSTCAQTLKQLMDLVRADGWDPQRIKQLSAIRHEGSQLYKQWSFATDPPEPYPSWFGNRVPTNRLDVIPGSSHRPPSV
ncbi:MAG: sulfatase-like hydrolase/transferase [Phycisphaeraceae bacterium]|nr:sulfatase-like hydrolase/transferase [Phycisphaeraceae bacterium]